jgi:hypothetical protein
MIAVDAGDVVDRGDQYPSTSNEITGRQRVLLQHALLFLSENPWLIVGTDAEVEAAQEAIMELQEAFT